MELGFTAEPLWAARLARTPFAAALARGAPLLVGRGDPPQLVFATPAALSVFGAFDAVALETMLFSGQSVGAGRLVRLATTLPPDAPPRLEQLRFFIARKPMAAPWLCARLTRDGETFFVAADASAPAEGASDRPAIPLAAQKAMPSARFLWRLDAEGRFGPPDPALVGRLGASAPREGESLDALSARIGLDPAWREAVAARRTFSRLKVTWPEPDRANGEVASVSGAPAFAGGGRFDGFRGFGVLSGERVALPKPVEAPAPAAAPAVARPPAPKLAAGDAAALISLLQRQHGQPAALASPAGSASGPALAIISALATLLQPKTPTETKTTPARRPAPESAPPANAAAPTSGSAPPSAEIVVLRPHASTPSAEARESESVTLTSQERDAFKEIARALGANVRNARNSFEPPAAYAPEAAVPGPSAHDFAALLDDLPIAALVTRAGEALYANKTLLDLTGFADLAEFRARDGLKTIFRGREPATLAPGGAVSSAPLVTAEGHILTVDAQVRTIVWQNVAAELVALRRSREAEHQAAMRALERDGELHAARARDLSVALETARDGMVRLNSDGRILGMNKGAERLFGWDQKERAGESFAVLFAPESQDAVAAALERLKRGEDAPGDKFEARARGADGELFSVKLDVGRLANRPEPDAFLLLTDLRSSADGASAAALEEAERTSAAKTELLSRVSHEMRTPLHAILGFAEVILEERMGPIGNVRYRDYVKNIYDSGRHVLSLANDLLDLARIELGKMELQFAPLDVNAVVRECVTLMQPQAARERVIVRLSLFDRLPNVMADERSLKQIMLNLMANAVKYNEPGGQVIVSTALDEQGSVILRVRDTGVGMNESELAIALEPFRRVPGAKATEGSGIGLPLTKALVEANHGGFSIKSRKDQGTLVEIAFPVRRAAQ